MADIHANRPKTAREEAAAAERSKREAEMAELRRLRAEQMSKQQSVHLSAAEQARKKREEEMAELRRTKAAENEEMRRKLSEKGGALTTDMAAWQMDQINARKGDKANKLAAQSNLQGYRGSGGDSKTAAELDKDAEHQAQKDHVTKMGQLELGSDNYKPDMDDMEKHVVQEEVEHFSAPAPGKIALPEETSPPPAEKSAPPTMKLVTPAPAAEAEVESAPPSKPAPAAEAKAEEESAPPAKPARKSVMFNQAPDENIPAAKEDPPPERKMPPKKSDSMEVPVGEGDDDNEAVSTLNAPMYSRVDIKFSFGLIVRSSAADGFETENLRDNETLRKCMEGTSKILKEEMPNPPNIDKLKSSSLTSFKVKFPEAYYDPTLEPTVISIEEDKKAAEEGKVTAKGNKRTLVKASFPVFLRDESVDEEGKKRSARMLKETKTTVFKALRAAVSGGSFLR